MNTTKEYTVRYQAIGRYNEVEIREKSFKSNQAMMNWIVRQEENNSRFVGVVAYSI